MVGVEVLVVVEAAGAAPRPTGGRRAGPLLGGAGGDASEAPRMVVPTPAVAFFSSSSHVREKGSTSSSSESIGGEMIGMIEKPGGMLCSPEKGLRVTLVIFPEKSLMVAFLRTAWMSRRCSGRSQVIAMDLPLSSSFP